MTLQPDESESGETRYIIDTVGTLDLKKQTEERKDPFMLDVKEVNKLNGLTPQFKRRTTYLAKSLEGEDGAKSKQLTPLVYTGYSVFDVAYPNHNLDYLAKLYDISPYHTAAVDARTANVVGLGYDFQESEKLRETLDAMDNQDRRTRAERRVRSAKRELKEWLRRMNKENLFTETLMQVYVDLLTTGNGYLEIGRKSNGQIGYIGHIQSVDMRVRVKRDGFVQMIGRDVVFFRNFGEKTADPIGGDPRPNEVIHFKRYSPTDPYYGVPAIVAASTAVAGNEFAARYNLDFFENKAVPRYLIILKGATLGPAAERKLLEFFEVNLKNKPHRSLYVPLPAEDPNNKIDISFEPIETGIQEGSFKEYSKTNREEILFVNRTPISKIGIADGISLAMAKDADRTFKEQVAGPDQRIINEYVNKIIAEQTDALDFKLNELTLTDEDTQSKIDERYVRLQVVTPNEIRPRLGLPPRPGGDKPVVIGAAAAAQQNTTTNGTRTRDQQRTAQATDSAGQGRSPQGDGRTTP